MRTTISRFFKRTRLGDLCTTSVRSKLILLGLLSFLPVALLMVFNSWHQRRVEVSEARDRMAKILNFAVLHDEDVIRLAQRTLSMLADVPEVRERGEPANALLARLLKDSPEYTNFVVCGPDGQVISSAVPLKSAVTFSDRPYFRDVLQSRSLFVGPFLTGRITGKPVIPFGYTVRDRRGRVTAVLFAPLDLSRVTKFEAEIDVQTPPNSSYVKLDRHGNVLSAYPEAKVFGRGHPLEASLFDRISREKKGTFQAVGIDGVERLYLFSPYRSPMNNDGGYALLGIPTEALFAKGNRLLALNLAALSIGAMSFLAILWIGGNAMIIRPIRALADASKRLSAGDLAARSGLAPSDGEYGQLGKVFDQMAEELQRRQHESLKLEETLRASVVNAENERAKTEAIIAGIADCISIQDRNFTVLYQNQALKDLAGDHVGETCYKAYHHGDRICGGCAVAQSLRDGRVHTVEMSRMVDDGTLYLEHTASPLTDASGDIVASIEVIRDITERKQAERQIRRGVSILSALRDIDRHILSGADVQETLGKACDAIMAMGYRYCWVGLAEPDRTVRPVAARGVSLEDLEGAKVRWDDSPHGQGPSGVVIKTGESLVSHDILEDRRFNRWRKAYVNLGCRASASYPLKTAEGRVWGVFHVYGEDAAGFGPAELQDLETFAGQVAVAMESSRQWEAVRDAHQRLNFHVNRMPMGYIVWDTKCRVREWNPAAERIFGWSAEEAVGKSAFGLIVAPSEEARLGSVWAKLLRGDDDGYSLNDNVRKDGKRITCEWFNAPLRDAQGNVNGVLSMVHDVTGKTQLERQLHAAQRMEAIGTLAGGIAHDFNNALTGIFGFTEVLRSRVSGNENALSDVDEILRCAERAATLTRQLLTYSRRQIISPVNLCLNSIVTDLLKLASKVVGEHIEIRTFLAKDLPAVRADAGQMEQVLMNLVLNARDAMPGGGQIVIASATANVDDEFVRYYPYMRVGKYVVLSVSDNGFGMDAKTRERVFEPFFTTKGPEKGTGLGLAVVYGIVKQQNGYVDVHSEPGKGSTFKIYLPLVDAVPDVLAAEQQSEVSRGTETILLAEDDESVRRLSVQTLRDLGYTVLAARDGEEAVAAFERSEGHVDLALLDVVMPAVGGKEAYEAMRKVNPSLKVLFMSGYTTDTVHKSFVLTAGVPFLPKPFGPFTLARKVRDILDEECSPGRESASD